MHITMISRYTRVDKNDIEPKPKPKSKPVHCKGYAPTIAAIKYIRGKVIFIMQCVCGNEANKEE